MICFVIALRSKESTTNWDNIINHFVNTLDSIFNQTNPEFQVFVGCNEIPDLQKKYDDRLHFVCANLPIPKTWEEKCRDRSWKLCLCAIEIRKQMKSLCVSGGGTFVFPVDADDYVSNRIAEWVSKHPSANGFKSKDGYKWVMGSSKLEITPYYGGTMNIMKMFEDDLPLEMPDQKYCFDKEVAISLTKRYPIRWYDIEVEKKYAELGRPLERLPFRSTIYVLNTGDNISNLDPNITRNDRFHPIALLRSFNPFTHRKLSKAIKEEFGMI